jgi:putative acetyltransferase
MKKPTRRKIAIRAAETDDYQALARLYADRNAYAQTLQLPFPSPELWRERLAQNDETRHTLVAMVAGDIVGNLGLTRLIRVRRMSGSSEWACATHGRARAFGPP